MRIIPSLTAGIILTIVASLASTSLANVVAEKKLPFRPLFKSHYILRQRKQVGSHSVSLRHCHDHLTAQQMRHQTLHRSCLLVNRQMSHRNNQQMLHLYNQPMRLLMNQRMRLLMNQRMRLLMNQQMLRQVLRLKGQHALHHLVNLPISQLMNQPMNPPVNQHANHHISQPMNHQINQPVNHPIVQPVSQPASLLRFHLPYHRGVHPQPNRHLPPHHMSLR
jgi:hypothetical protein